MQSKIKPSTEYLVIALVVFIVILASSLRRMQEANDFREMRALLTKDMGIREVNSEILHDIVVLLQRNRDEQILQRIQQDDKDKVSKKVPVRPKHK